MMSRNPSGTRATPVSRTWPATRAYSRTFRRRVAEPEEPTRDAARRAMSQLKTRTPTITALQAKMKYFITVIQIRSSGFAGCRQAQPWTGPALAGERASMRISPRQQAGLEVPGSGARYVPGSRPRASAREPVHPGRELAVDNGLQPLDDRRLRIVMAAASVGARVAAVRWADGSYGMIASTPRRTDRGQRPYGARPPRRRARPHRPGPGQHRRPGRPAPAGRAGPR